MVQLYINSGLRCTSCGNYCRECDQQTKKCVKCLEGYRIVGGNCVMCDAKTCSCGNMAVSGVVYSKEVSFGEEKLRIS